MVTCKICLRKFKALRFQSKRVFICGRCTNDLNSYKEVAEDSYRAARELLRTGILRRATIDVSSPNVPLWKQQKAERILENLEAEVDRALPKWINRLLADESNRTKIFKIIRAHRRGLLHLDRPKRWGYPNNWNEVAQNIRKLDRLTCVSCSKGGVELHVHHIVYASNFGTHQRANLVTLCRECHEKEHKRHFDFGENMQVPDDPPFSTDESNSDLIEDGIRLAGFHVESGVRSFTHYAKLMIDEFGEDITPYLLSFWEGIRNHPDLDTRDMTDIVESARQFQAFIHSNES